MPKPARKYALPLRRTSGLIAADISSWWHMFGCLKAASGLHNGFAALLLGMALATPAHACEGAAEAGPKIFPLKVEAGKRYLEDASGRPFLMTGDAAWSLIAQLTNEDADRYLQDRQRRGFNAILVNLLEHRFASNAPANIYGDKPFLVDGDYSTPNEAYFRHADWVLKRACELGLLVLLAPSYTGYGGKQEGWYQEMIKNGPAKLHDYGRFLGERYQGFDNILWVHAGDFDPPDKDLVRAIADGITEFDKDALTTAHGAPEGSALGYWGREPWLNVNNIYAGDQIYAHALRQFADPLAMPFFLIESIYENEHDSSEDLLRTQAYESLLSGASGQVFGNNPIWHFDGPGLYETDMTWQQALGSSGSQSMTYLSQLFGSIPWWNLVPDTDHSVLAGGEVHVWTRIWAYFQPLKHISAARSPDGRLALIYIPDGRAVAVNLQGFAGPQISAQWFDPTAGTYMPAEGTPLAKSKSLATLAPPSANSAGFKDWVLLLRSEPSTN